MIALIGRSVPFNKAIRDCGVQTQSTFAWRSVRVWGDRFCVLASKTKAATTPARRLRLQIKGIECDVYGEALASNAA
jgi:hypothetical protein